jgi:antigen 43
VQVPDYIVSSGQTLSSSLGPTYSVTVLSGGKLASSVIEGVAQIYGAADVGTLGTAGDYAQMSVMSGGVASGVVAVNGALVIEAGGSAFATVDDYSLQVDQGGLEFGGVVSGTPAQGGGALFTDGVTSGDVVDSGGWELTQSGGSSLAETIDAFGSATVDSGGVLSGAVVMSGADLAFYIGATVENLTLSNGASAALLSGVTLSGAVIDAGASLVGSGAGASIEGVVVVSSGGLESDLSVGAAVYLRARCL